MDAGKLWMLRDFIGANKVLFKIPVYQRNYDWAESNCIRLLDDVRNIIETDEKHFLGTIVRTEMAHIQTQAAKNRYMDAGISEVEVLVGEDERTCPVCSKLANKRYPIKGVMPVPAHPRCRCCVIPVLDSLALSKPYANMNKSEFIGKPASATSGSNEDIREWYYVNIHDIPARLDYSLPLEQQAIQASKMRSKLKMEARAAMKDRKLAKKLNQKKKPRSFEEMVADKMSKYEFETREQALQDIIRSASTTNKSVDDELFGGK